MRSKRVSELVLATLLSVLLLPAVVLADNSEVAVTVRGDVACVGPDGDYTTIEEGLDAVSEGGMVNVAAGTYPGEMWDKPIHGGRLLKSPPGEERVEFQENGISITATKKGVGTPVIGTALLVDGTEELPTKEDAAHFDLYLSTTAGVESLTAAITLPKSVLAGLSRDSLVVYWHNGSEWKECSDYTFGNPTNCLTIRVDSYTSPPLLGLNGTPFGVGGNLGALSSQIGRLIPVAVMMCVIVTAFMSLWRRVDIVAVAFLLIVTVIFVIAMTQVLRYVD